MPVRRLITSECSGLRVKDPLSEKAQIFEWLRTLLEIQQEPKWGNWWRLPGGCVQNEYLLWRLNLVLKFEARWRSLHEQ